MSDALPSSHNDNIVGVQRVAPYEANLIARANQERLAIAERTKPQLEGLRTQINRLDHLLREEASELAAAWEQVRAADVRPYKPPMSGALYNGLIAVLVLLETPVNASALDFLRLPELETYGAALSFGLINAWAAKCTARVLRHKGWVDRAWRDWSVAALVNGALLAAILAMAQLRSVQAEQELAAMSFLVLQLAFYAAALICGFLQLDPNAQAEQLGKRIKARRGALHATWSARARLAAAHNHALEAARLRILAVMEDCQERIFQYRDNNMHHRTEPAPTWFGRAASAAAFAPVPLGFLVDEHPDGIGAVVHSNMN